MSPGRIVLSASRPARPRPAASSFAPTRPALGMSGFWVRQVRSSGENFRRRVFDASEGTGDACLLGEMFCRRPVLPCPAPPPRRAPRLDPPVVCPGFGLGRYTAVLRPQLGSQFALSGFDRSPFAKNNISVWGVNPFQVFGRGTQRNNDSKVALS